MKTAAKFVASILVTGTCIAQAPAPKDGYVPNEKTAIQIAKAVLEGMQGKTFVSKQEPFHADLEGSVCSVEGRYIKPAKNRLILGGGGLHMEIDKNTGAILGYYFKH